MNEYALFNKAILFTVMEYMARYKAEKGEMRAIDFQLLVSLKGYLVFHKFSAVEQKEVTRVTNTEDFKKLGSEWISDFVFALELMKLYIEDVPKNCRPHLGISDKRLLLGGRATFTLGMLGLKKDNFEKYEEKKKIITSTVINAKHIYAYFRRELVK